MICFQTRFGRAAQAIVLFILFTTLIVGCALTPKQREATDRFALAANGIGVFSSEELQRMRATTIKMNTTVLKLGGRPDPTGLDGAFDPDKVLLRITAAEALASYGRLLLALVNASQEAKLAEASNAFASSFNALANSEATNGRLPTLNATQTEELAQLVRGIGLLFVEWQKAKAVKEIVAKTQPAVNQV